MPDNPRGSGAVPSKTSPRTAGEWNTYDVVAVDGVIKLAVNGKFVNGISKSTQKKGYFAWNPRARRSTSGTSRSWNCFPESRRRSRPRR